MKYVSRPAEVEAMLWAWGTSDDRDGGSTAPQIVDWVNANGGKALYEAYAAEAYDVTTKVPARIAVRTMNGWAYAAPGHYIVMGEAKFPGEVVEYRIHDDSGLDLPVHRECRDFYPCEPETFKRRWAPASEVER